jgi:hypothetical protein
MTKLSNECIPVNTVEEMTVPENTITAPAATVEAAAPAPAPSVEAATEAPASSGEEASEVEETTEVPADPAD